MASSSLTAVLDAITEGDADDGFERVYAAIKDRQRVLSRKKMNALTSGDRVVFNELARPKYLIGKGATVDRLLQSNISIVLDEPIGKFGNTRPITTPLGIVDIA